MLVSRLVLTDSQLDEIERRSVYHSPAGGMIVHADVRLLLADLRQSHLVITSLRSMHALAVDAQKRATAELRRESETHDDLRAAARKALAALDEILAPGVDRTYRSVCFAGADAAADLRKTLLRGLDQ